MTMRLLITDTMIADVAIRDGVSMGFSQNTLVFRIAGLSLQFPSREAAEQASHVIADAVIKKRGTCSIKMFGARPLTEEEAPVL